MWEARRKCSFQSTAPWFAAEYKEGQEFFCTVQEVQLEFMKLYLTLIIQGMSWTAECLGEAEINLEKIKLKAKMLEISFAVYKTPMSQ